MILQQATFDFADHYSAAGHGVDRAAGAGPRPGTHCAESPPGETSSSELFLILFCDNESWI